MEQGGCEGRGAGWVRGEGGRVGARGGGAGWV